MMSTTLLLPLLMDQWKPIRGFSDPRLYRDVIDSLDHSHVRSYERRRDITPFQDICWYSGWIMACRDKRVRHLPERDFRQYGYVQIVHMPPTDIGPLAPGEVVTAFMEFALHVLSQQERGDLVSDNEPRCHSRVCMIWFCTISHPIVNPPVAIPDYTTDSHPHFVPPYEEVLVEQQWARHPPDPYQIISNIRARVDSATGHPDLFRNPYEVLRLMQGIQSRWSML
ncbi:hypothetical protein MtrunA17_Chr7g0215301 [Medicago truncatula]|uniref:Aminotransferase-like plant mobile domain-containing protein n=1 Tax=Medicago truncatula TaxID=3880 RepID=A0A396GSE8_MEDTR|nr:hypothetical protein MtrunA17_Chr7g0215301 [Medicago truncatula]